MASVGRGLVAPRDICTVFACEDLFKGNDSRDKQRKYTSRSLEVFLHFLRLQIEAVSVSDEGSKSFEFRQGLIQVLAEQGGRVCAIGADIWSSTS